MFTSKPENFFNAITAEIMSYINAGLDIFIIPISLAFCGGFFIFLLTKCISDYNDNRGDEMKGKILWMFLILAIAGLLLTKKVWWNILFVG